MSEPIDFNPKYKDPRTYDWSKALDTLEGYESPVTLYIQQIASEIEERRENEIVSAISERMAVNIDKNELTKALSYDRNQYSKGFLAGYERAFFNISCQLGQAVGILTDILNQVRGDQEAET